MSAPTATRPRPSPLATRNSSLVTRRSSLRHEAARARHNAVRYGNIPHHATRQLTEPPLSPGAWSDRYGDGKRAFLSSEAEFPEHVGDQMLDEAGGLGSWAWEEGKAWEVDKLWTSLGCEYLRTDPDGWVYAPGWNDMLAKIHGAPHELGHERPKHPAGTVRRRRWVRWREPAGWTGKDGFEVTHTIKVDDSAIDTREWCVSFVSSHLVCMHACTCLAVRTDASSTVRLLKAPLLKYMDHCH